MTSLSSGRPAPSRVALAILVGGVVAGTIDLGAAMLASGAKLVPILHFIASGLIGKAAAGDDVGITLLGVALQEIMGLIIAAVFVLASLRLPALRRHWVTAGLGYGVVVYFVMNYVVMPLSKVGHPPHFSWPSFGKNMVAMLVFGLIVAAASRLVDRRR